jgi:hypothetical protein
MFFIEISKKETRRSGKDRRKSMNPIYFDNPASERRNFQDRRNNGDRRSDVGRRSGIYYRLSDNQKDTLDTIMAVLEIESI